MKIFVGSSSEADEHMMTVASWLEKQKATPVRWNETGVFPPGQYTLARLLELAEQVDGAILIFGPDDQVVHRGSAVAQPRDNVLIEYGIFAGILGPERAIVCRAGAAKWPLDLDGVTFVQLDSPNQAELAIRNWLRRLATKAPEGAIAVKMVSELEHARVVSELGHTRRLLDRALAGVGELYKGTHDFKTRLRVLEDSKEIFIDAKGNGRLRETRRYAASRRLHTFDRFEIHGDPPVGSFFDLDLKATCDCAQATIIPEFDGPLSKRFLVAYSPPIAAGREHQVTLDWQWPRGFYRLAEGRNDSISTDILPLRLVQRLSYRLVVDAEIPPLRISSKGYGEVRMLDEQNTGGKHIYSLQAVKLKPGLPVQLSLEPV